MGIQTWWDSRFGGVSPVTAGPAPGSNYAGPKPPWSEFLYTYNTTSYNTSSDPADTYPVSYSITITAPFEGQYTLYGVVDNSGSMQIFNDTQDTESTFVGVATNTNPPDLGFKAEKSQAATTSIYADKNDTLRLEISYENHPTDGGADFATNPGAGAFLLEGPDTDPPPVDPSTLNIDFTINGSTADQTVIEGDAVFLEWEVSGVPLEDLQGDYNYTLTPGISTPGYIGNQNVVLNSTRSYVYTVSLAIDPTDPNYAQESRRITVTVVPPPSELDLKIIYDGAESTSVSIDKGETILLEWSAKNIVPGTLILKRQNTDPGANKKTLISSLDSVVGLNGEVPYTPKRTFVYYLQATGLDGNSYEVSVDVNVTDPGDGTPPPTDPIDSDITSFPPEPDAPDDPVEPGGDPVFPGTGLLDAYGVLRIGLLNTSDAPPDTFQVDGAEDTFSVGRYRTDGWDETTSFVEATFNGNVSFEVGGNSNEGTSTAFVLGVPPHTHYVLGTQASGYSFFADTKSGNPPTGTAFTDDARNAALENDPQPIIEYTRNGFPLRSHSHHLSFGPVSGVARLGNDNKAGNYGGPGVSAALNPGQGYWNTTDAGNGPFNQQIDQSTNYNIGKKLKKVIDVSNEMGVTPNIGNIVMTNRSRIAFDESLKVYLQSGEGINLIGNYTRTKYIIKAYVANNNVNL